MFLNCHTYFSLRYGTLSPRQLAEKAAQWNIRTLALTDINNTSCALEFIGACRSAGVNPVLGIDFRDADGQQLFIGLARNAAGWKALNRLLSEASL